MKITVKCSICQTEAQHNLSYTAMRCATCGCSYDPFELTIPDIVKMQREKLKLTRKQTGAILGYSPKSIKRYEFVRCTRPYRAKMQELFNQRIKNHE